MAEYIGEEKPLGGLLLLLPQVFDSQNTDSSKDESGHDSAKETIKEVLLELERFLIHANIPVSDIDYSPLCACSRCCRFCTVRKYSYLLIDFFL